jgi:NADH dehydrogenase
MAAAGEHKRHHVVIVGGGFGGLYTAQALRNAAVRITLLDKRNFHLFQPLLYQVATGGLSPGDIASPLRAILKKQRNVTVVQAEVIDVDPVSRRVILQDGEINYDSLVLAAGVKNDYFGKKDWESQAPGLKTIEDALKIRGRILSAFEAAEREPDPVRRKAWLTFVVIGGGPTGVELAGAIAELAHGTLENEFKNIDPTDTEIILMEGQPDILPPYPGKSSEDAQRALKRLGVRVLTQALAEDIQSDAITYHSPGGDVLRIPTRTVLWAAGMQAVPLTKTLEKRTGAVLDRTGRLMVDPYLRVQNFPEIFVIGDMAHVRGEDGAPLPGIAPVAMQQGRYIANSVEAQLAGKRMPEFRYQDKGNLAVIGRNAAVAAFGNRQISGFPAWFAWIFIHLWYLIEFDNKILVLIQWAWNYFTRKRGARLITGESPRSMGNFNQPGGSLPAVDASVELADEQEKVFVGATAEISRSDARFY